ncbi:MAG: 30S ribosomal protein S17 [Caldisericia bacterium]|nr:30S ribosomal protein S17 [Caldisericia bacterium]MDD4614565.1 30S ribosomal protein S17 [Caldisericia bacterium]
MSVENRKVVTAVVVSDKNKNFRVVEQKIRVLGHKLYRKMVNKTRKYHVYDEENTSKIGDVVTIQESKPYAATVRWKIISIQSSDDMEGALK